MNNRTRNRDIILDNKFNTNEIEFVQLPDIKIEASYRCRNKEVNDSYEYNRLQNLDYFMEKYLLEFNLYNKTKSKNELLLVFYKMLQQINKEDYNEVEFFVYFCENLNLNMKEFYNLLLPRIKEKMLKILKENTNGKVFKKSKFTKLF